MRSSAFVATSLATAARVAADPSNYNDCVATCKPVLDVSAQCGLPVPANPQNALDPATWSTSAWTNPSFWAGGVVPFGGPNSVGWSSAGGPSWGPWGGYGGSSGWGSGGGWGGYGAGWGAGWGSPGGAGYGAGAGAGAGWNGNGAGWNGASWNLATWAPTQTNCVCTTKAFNIQTVGNDCVTCLSKSNALNNPYLSSLATTCNFANTFYPANGVNVGANPVPVATLPVPAPVSPQQPAGTIPLAPKPVNRRDVPAPDGEEEPAPSAEAQKKWNNGGGYGGNGGGWAPAGGSPGSVSVQQQPQLQNGGQPVFFSGAEQSVSMKGMVGLALAGTAAFTIFFL